MNDLHLMAAKSREAAWALASSSLQKRNAALRAMADALCARSAAIFAANSEDLAAAEKQQLAAPLLGRLKFREENTYRLERYTFRCEDGSWYFAALAN